MNLLHWPFASRQQLPSTGVPLLPVDWGTWDEADAKQRYALLRAYTENNGLYETSQRLTYADGTWQQAMRGLRTVAGRVVEFHAAHLWPGNLPAALPIETEHEAIIEPIEQVWTWSNWNAQKQVAARWIAMLGDLFIKVVQREDGSRVYFELIDPAYVSDFDTDERGYLTYIRVDIPRTERRGDKPVRMTHTEVWTKETFRTWVHDRPDGEELSKLGTPLQDVPISTFGIDFVPFVHAKFRDIGEARGQAAVWTAISKIDEGNLQATRLSQLLFRYNNVIWALGAGGMDRDGRPLPAPRLEGDAVTTGANGDTITLGETRLLRLPGNSKLESLIPAINYEAALSVLNAHMQELEHDLPELAYARITDVGADLSGRALRVMLTPAIDRAIEARGNAEGALMRANQMALTIGAAAGLFSGIGTYAAGDFDHAFTERPIVPIDESEEAAATFQRAQTAELLASDLPVEERLRLVFTDWDEQKIQDVIDAKAAETPAGLQQADQFAQSALTPEAMAQRMRTAVTGG